MAENIKDSVFKISRGSASRNKIGSKNIPHRLRKEEKQIIKRALKYGFLEYRNNNRENILNIYSKLCEAYDLTPIYCFHSTEKSNIQIHKLNLETRKKTFEVIDKNNLISDKNSNTKNITINNVDRKKAKNICKGIAQNISKKNILIDI